ELERLVRHALTGLVLGDDDAVEGLSGLDDLGGPLLDRLEVFGGEGFGDVEVEVVAVGDVGPDAELGSGEQLLDGLGGHVSGRVAEDVQAGIGVDGDRCDRVAGVEFAAEVSGFAVEPHRNDRAVRGEDLRTGQPLFPGMLSPAQSMLSATDLLHSSAVRTSRPQDSSTDSVVPNQLG